MKIKSLFGTFILLFVFSVLSYFVSSAYAEISCQPIYGGGQTCVTSENILVDKKILNPKTNVLVDNLGINDPKFDPDTVVNFQISVKNTGNNLLNKVDVKDIFPQHLNFFGGPGNFDPNTKELTFSIENLKPNEIKTFTVLGKIVDAAQLQISQGVVCVVNQVQAVNSANTSQVSQDNSQFCIEKKVLGETAKGGFPVLPIKPTGTSPSTGAESLALFSLIPTGITGWFLRKYSFKKEVKK